MPLIIALILTLFSLRLHPPPPAPPQAPAPIPTKFVQAPTPTPRKIATPEDNSPWGVAQKVGPHTYRIKIQNDDAMGSPDEILQALNTLRARHGSQPLQKDDRLCRYAQQRAELFESIGATDEHRGFEDFLQNQDGFKKLGFGRVGENSSYGYILSGVHLIEFVYMQSPDHNANQLNSAWDHGCAGVAGSSTNLIFATAPL